MAVVPTRHPLCLRVPSEQPIHLALSTHTAATNGQLIYKVITPLARIMTLCPPQSFCQISVPSGPSALRTLTTTSPSTSPMQSGLKASIYFKGKHRPCSMLAISLFSFRLSTPEGPILLTLYSRLLGMDLLNRRTGRSVRCDIMSKVDLRHHGCSAVCHIYWISHRAHS